MSRCFTTVTRRMDIIYSLEILASPYSYPISNTFDSFNSITLNYGWYLRGNVLILLAHHMFSMYLLMPKSVNNHDVTWSELIYERHTAGALCCLTEPIIEQAFIDIYTRTKNVKIKNIGPIKPHLTFKINKSIVR